MKELYQSVIIETIKGIKNEFLNEGLDDHVLFELQSIWESKLAQHGVEVFDKNDEYEEEGMYEGENQNKLGFRLRYLTHVVVIVINESNRRRRRRE